LRGCSTVPAKSDDDEPRDKGETQRQDRALSPVQFVKRRHLDALAISDLPSVSNRHERATPVSPTAPRCQTGRCNRHSTCPPNRATIHPSTQHHPLPSPTWGGTPTTHLQQTNPTKNKQRRAHKPKQKTKDGSKRHAIRFRDRGTPGRVHVRQNRHRAEPHDGGPVWPGREGSSRVPL
jgi:hypothetical protein